MDKIKELIKKAKYCSFLSGGRMGGGELKDKYFDKLPKDNIHYDSAQIDYYKELSGDELVEYLFDRSHWASYKDEAYFDLNILEDCFEVSLKVERNSVSTYHRLNQCQILVTFKSLDFKYLDIFDLDIQEYFSYKSKEEMRNIIKREEEELFQKRLIQLRSKILK